MNSYGFRRFSLFPPVIKTIVIINVIVFIVQHLILSIFTVGGVPLYNIILHYFALQPFFDGSSFIPNNSFYIWQLITYQFLHANFWHIFFNLFVLWMFGTELEDEWGQGKFLTFYLLSGIGAAIVHLLISPLLGTIAPTVGASGAIYGVLLAFGLSYPDRPIYMFPFFIPIKAKIFVIIMIAIELIFGFSVNDQVARFAHLGGAATGFLLLNFGDKLNIYSLANRLFKRKSARKNDFEYYFRQRDPYSEETRIYSFKKEPENVSYTVYREETPTSTKIIINVNGEDITQKQIDEILDKISAFGYQSLTEREKHILIELSKKL
jgi:membrane associated rhomboid family serine protease